MQSRSRRIAVVVSLIGVGGFLMAGPGTSCTSFVAQSALVATDFCFIFDCVNGPLGGTLDPCAGADPNSPEYAVYGGPYLTDCEVGGP